MRNERILAGLLAWFAAALILTSGAGPALGQQTAAETQPAYLNPSLPLDQRVDDLVSRMTMEQKAGQLVNQAAAIPRLQVPAYNWWSEALHGVRIANVTVFPQVIGLASTRNTPLIKEMATAISIEARAKFHEAQQQAASGAGAGGGFGRALGLDFCSPPRSSSRWPRKETDGDASPNSGRPPRHSTYFHRRVFA